MKPDYLKSLLSLYLKKKKLRGLGEKVSRSQDRSLEQPDERGGRKRGVGGGFGVGDPDAGCGVGQFVGAVMERRRLLPYSLVLVSFTVGRRFAFWRWGLLRGVWESMRWF